MNYIMFKIPWFLIDCELFVVLKIALKVRLFHIVVLVRIVLSFVLTRAVLKTVVFGVTGMVICPSVKVP